MLDLKCLNCNKVFQVYNCRKEKAKFCSTECKYEHKRKTGRSFKDCTCKYCGKSFKVERRLKGKYCSEECYHLDTRIREERKCFNCGKVFTLKKSAIQNCCSIECRREYQGKNKIDRTFYHTPEWKKVRIKTLARDDFRCVKCGDENAQLHVHHIKPVAKGGTDELDNLMTLCLKCHRKIHGKLIKTK